MESKRPFRKTEVLSMLAVLAVGVLIAVWMAASEPRVSLSDLIIALFSVSGTLVALILPAAGLVSQFVTQLIDFSVDRVFEDRIAPEEKRRRAGANKDIISKARSNGRSAWRASLYSLAAFVLSSMAFIAKPIRVDEYTFFVDYLLVGVTIGFLLASAVWFCVPSYWLYDFKLLTIKLGLLGYAEDSPAEGEEVVRAACDNAPVQPTQPPPRVEAQAVTVSEDVNEQNSPKPPEKTGV